MSSQHSETYHVLTERMPYSRSRIYRSAGLRARHQILHFFSGFIADVGEQLNSCENSRELEMVPMTRNGAGLCGSLSMLRWVVSGRLLLHQTYSNVHR